MTNDTKVCSDCAEAKGRDQFNKDKSKLDGLCSKCRDCNKAHAARWYIENKDAALAQRKERFQNKREFESEQMRQWRLANLEKKRASDAAYYAANKEKFTAYALMWSRANRASVNRRNAEYKKRNPQQVLDQSHRRRARKLGSAALIVASGDITRLKQRFGGMCAYCGSSGKMTIDHVVPLSRGGTHAIGNLLPACQPCNFSKHTKFLYEWIIWKQKNALAA